MRPQRSAGEGPAGQATPIVFEKTATGLAVVDTVERARHHVETQNEASLDSAPPNPFTHPVDDVVSFRTTSFTVSSSGTAFVETGSGREEIPPGTATGLGAGPHQVDLGFVTKVYLWFDSRAFVENEDDGIRFDFPGSVEVRLGARSPHEHPAATITTTSDPLDVMTAVSHLSSALKTTSPERSFPTLRGHPPLVELGDELAVPAGLTRPDVDVTLAVPADYRSVFVAAPLAFYLAADLEPAPKPELHVGGEVYPLAGDADFETRVADVLEHVFTLDCVTRTEGLYDVPLHERDAIEDEVDLDFAALYDASLADRVNAYLDVPLDVVAPHVPEWKQTTHVSPTPDSVEVLPFLLDDLSLVRSPETRSVGDSNARAAAVEEFMRNDDALTRSTDASSGDVPATVRPADEPSVEQSWVGEGAPVGATKPTREAFLNRLDRPQSEGPLRIGVVCNEDEMAAETDLVDEVYGARDDLPFSVNVHRNLATDELRSVFARDHDFLHFIGHVDGAGFRCRDGVLYAEDLDEVNVDAFFLNACRSYDQALSLIERGSIAGVATVRDVVNRGAEALGVAIARLLNLGFSLNAALEIASDESVMSNRYVVVGDGGFAVAQCDSAEPNLSAVERVEEGFELSFRAYPRSQGGMGAIVKPYLEQNDAYFVGSGDLGSFTVSRDELEAFLSLSRMPIRVGDELRWCDELSVDEIP